MKYKVTTLKKQTPTERNECVTWCEKYIGKHRQAWTVVWVNGYIYGFRKEAHAVLFTLKFVK